MILKRLVFGGLTIGTTFVLLVSIFATALAIPFEQKHASRQNSGFWDNLLEKSHPSNNPFVYFALTKAGFISSDFWERALQMGDSVHKYTEELLDNASSTFAIPDHIRDFKGTMAGVLSTTSKFRSEIQTTVESLDVADVSEKLSRALAVVLEELHDEFPPTKDAPNHEKRVEMFSHVSKKVEGSLVDTLVPYGVSEAKIRSHFGEIEPHVIAFLTVTGDLAEQHPVLLDTLIFSGAALLIPEAWLLRPLLGLFGFGPYGPVERSAASWAQRRFFGGVISKGSWFSHLQKAAMKFKVPPGVGRKIIGGIGLGIGMAGTMFRC